MLELIKNFAIQKLQEIMAGNSLSSAATGEAAQEGGAAILGKLQGLLQGGDLSKLTELFSNEGVATTENPLTQEVQGEMTNILQNKGMSAEEATSEAGNVIPQVLDGLKEKFLSKDSGDAGFDIGQIGSLLGGNAGGIIGNVVKGLFK